MIFDTLALAGATVLYTAADPTTDFTSGLIQWGIGGVILLAFVWPSMKRAERREEARDTRDSEEAKARAALQEKLFAVLETSVRQQGEALAQWRTFETKEDAVHSAMVTSLNEITSTMRHLAQLVKAG